MVIGSVAAARASLGARLLLLSARRRSDDLPVPYMFSTSFKPNSLVLGIPPS